MLKRMTHLALAAALVLALAKWNAPAIASVPAYMEQFAAATGWSEPSASLTASGNTGTIRESNPAANYGFIAKEITVDLTANPYLQIHVPYAEAGSNWAVKVGDGIGGDVYIIADTPDVGVFTQNMAALTGWSGNKTFTVKIYVVGEAKAIGVDWLKVTADPLAITYPAAGSTVNTNTVTIAGSSVPNTATAIYTDGVLRATVTSDANGRFAAAGIDLATAGAHTIQAKAGLLASPLVSVTYDSSAVFYYVPKKTNAFHPGAPDFNQPSYDERLTLGAIQGIVNRDQPRLFVENHMSTLYTASDTLWREYYANEKGYSFIRLHSMEEVMHTFKYDVAGTVIYDQGQDATKAIAMTMAGLNDYVPVDASWLHGQFKALPVQEDLRGRWASNAAAYDWAQANLLYLTADKQIYSMGRSHANIHIGNDAIAWVGFDYGVRQQMFFFNLSPDAAAYPSDAARFDAILASLDEPGEVWGWAEPEWMVFNKRVSESGNYIVNTGANGSFHATVPADTAVFKQNTHQTTSSVTLEDKYYVIFQQTEGDTMKMPFGLFNGMWNSSQRGQVPLNYGINPILARDFPAVLEYFYDKAPPTATDYFYSGGGLGYVLLDQMAKAPGGAAKVSAYGNYANALLSAADLQVMDMWEDNVVNERAMETFMANAGLRGSTNTPLHTNNMGENMYTLSGKPIFVPAHNLHYWHVDSAQELKNRIEAVAAQHAKPFFIQVFGQMGLTGSQWVHHFDDTSGWTQTGAAISASNSIATITENNPAAAYGSVKYTLTADLDVRPNLEMVINEVSSGGQWAVKVSSGGAEYTVINDNSGTGAFWGNIRQATGWSGTKTFDIILYAIGEGQSFKLDYLALYTGYVEEFTNGALWSTVGATLDTVDGTAIIRENNPAGSTGHIATPVSLNMDTAHNLLITVPELEPGAQWALKVNDGAPIDITLVNDTSRTGVIDVPLKEITGWTGIKNFDLKVFAIGEGKSVQVEKIATHFDNQQFMKSVADLLNPAQFKVTTMDEAFAASELYLQRPAAYSEDFNTVGAWTAGGASIATASGQATIRDNPGGNVYGYVISGDVTINVDSHPRILVKVDHVESGGAWALKLSDGGADIELIPDKLHPGIYEAELKAKTGWTGTKTFKIKLFAVGDQKAVTVDYIRIK